MASISSTSGSNSLGNTALRGFGGMVSGIDRDSIVEQMTLGTTTKINNQKKKITELQWKQEAYRGFSDKIIDISDKYASYSSTSNLKNASIFGKNKITVHGKEESTAFITATGTSSMVNNVSILGVKQMATSTVRQSDAHLTGSIATGLTDLSDNTRFTFSNLEGATITFATWNNTDKNKGFENNTTLTLPSSFNYTTKGDDGKEKTEKITIDYIKDSPEQIADKLNQYLESSDLKLGDKAMKDAFKFEYNKTTDRMELVEQKGDGKGMGGFVIRGGSALEGLGYKKGTDSNLPDDFDAQGITLDNFNKNLTNFKDSYQRHPTALSYLTGKKLTFNYDGSQKSIELITKEEAAAMKDMTAEERAEAMEKNLQKRLDQAYGKDMVKAEFGADGLQFSTGKPDSTLSVVSSDGELLTNLGLEYGASNKVNLYGKLDQAALADGFAAVGMTVPGKDEALNLVINGVEIKGLTGDSSISDILSKINSNKEAGVKATYVDATGEFMLVSSETGEGRQITLDSDLAKAMFGAFEREADGSVKKDADGKAVEDQTKIKQGQNAQIAVSYGNGKTVVLDRASNTFNLEGLNVTISGVFGEEIKDGEWNTSKAVTFTAKADVDGVTEKVKSFFEDFNALVTEIGTAVRTRPDSGYGALTDEQKAEMDETSIENWEKKAKQGILYGDSAMRDLSADVETIFTQLMQNGASYEDLKEIGITYSEDYLDGGTLVFDEAKFRSAMESDPDKVADIFAGGGDMKKGLIDIVDETFTPYATRYASKNGGNSYGRLIDIAGSEKKPTTLMSNQIYKQLKEMQEAIDKLQNQLKVEQDRYISQFTTMESLINQMNTQSSYLSQITG